MRDFCPLFAQCPLILGLFYGSANTHVVIAGTICFYGVLVVCSCAARAPFPLGRSVRSATASTFAANAVVQKKSLHVCSCDTKKFPTYFVIILPSACTMQESV